MRLGTKECDFYVVNGLSIEKRISKIQKKKTILHVLSYVKTNLENKSESKL